MTHDPATGRAVLDALQRTRLRGSAVEQLGDLARIGVDVWIDDDGYLRRIRYASGGAVEGAVTITLDLTELGVALPSDWSRIPR